MNTLSRREDEALLKDLKSEALRKCDTVVKEFSACAEGRTMSVAWACRGQLKTMQDCMAKELTDDAIDNAREEKIRSRPSGSS